MTAEETGITVFGAGQATTTPDIARVQLGVSVRAGSVSEASSLARERAAAVLDALLNAGVARADITTTNYSIQADYDHPRGNERLLGYRATNEVQVTLRDLDALGSVIDSAVAAGDDDVSVGRLEFDVDDDTEARARSRQAAWEDAVTKARHLAELSGRELGPAIQITETATGPPGPRLLAAPIAAESTPIEAGTSTITVRLQTRFALR